jgi:hypothetical protein
MNWEAIGAVGEIIGAIAVVGTIGYLALQTRQANRLARANAVLSLQSEMRSHRGAVVFDPELSRIIAKVEENIGDELSEMDRFKLRVRLESTLSSIESVYIQYESGVITFSDIKKYHPLFLHIMADAKRHGAWKEERLSSGFVSYVHELSESGEGT